MHEQRRGDTRARFLMLGLLGWLSSCTTGGVSADATTRALCSSPQQGKRYSLCGQLTTGGLAANGVRYTLASSVNAATPVASSHYQISGGTFHASH